MAIQRLTFSMIESTIAVHGGRTLEPDTEEDL